MSDDVKIIIAVIVITNITALSLVMSSTMYIRARVSRVIDILHRIEDRSDERTRKS